MSEIRPTPFSGTKTTVLIDQTLKGPSATSLAVTQGGSLEPTEDWTGVVIAEGANGAMLLPRDRAILLLQKDSNGEYYIQGFTGWYQVVDEKVQSNPLNTWGTSVNGKTETEFVELLTATLK